MSALAARGAALAVVAAIAPLVPASSAQAAGRSCVQAGWRTVEANAQVRVVRRARMTPQYAFHRACFRDARRPVTLGDVYPEESISHVRVAGRFAAVRIVGCPKYPDEVCDAYVQVADVRSRRKRVYQTRGPAEVLLLDRSGAFVAALEPDVTGSAIVYGAGGRITEIARAPALDPASLVRHGDRLYWMQGAVPHTATLPPPRGEP